MPYNKVTLAPLPVLLLAMVLLAPQLATAAPSGPEDTASRSAMPGSAPEAPYILIERVLGADSALLWWDHVSESDYYQVHRGTTPYFDPLQGQGNQIADIDCVPCGAGDIPSYQDDGQDRFSADGTLAPVQVIGYVSTNYYWIVRGRNEGGEVSEVSNRVGEFDFGLVAGG
jgi:hypothetical protein